MSCAYANNLVRGSRLQDKSLVKSTERPRDAFDDLHGYRVTNCISDFDAGCEPEGISLRQDILSVLSAARSTPRGRATRLDIGDSEDIT